MFRAMNLFCQKNIYIYCFITVSLYLLSTYIIFKESPSLKTLNLTISSGSVRKKYNGAIKTTTTTTPTPIEKLLGLASDNSSKAKIYDPMQAYTFLMRRRIDRLTGKYSKNTNLLQLIRQQHRTNESVHIFYADVLPNTGKIKSPVFLNLGKNSTFYLADENLKLANHSGAGVIVLKITRFSTSQTSEVQETLKMLLHLAPNYGIKITIAVEDYMKRQVVSIMKDIKMFLLQYGKEECLYKLNRTGQFLPVIYILSSYLIPSNEWAEVMKANGRHSIRNTKSDAFFLGEMRDEEHEAHIRKSYFNGFFTSHLVNKASFASTWKNWDTIAKWADEKQFIWSAGILEATAGTAAVGVAFRTVLRCQPRPNFVSLMNVPNMNEYFHLSQDFLRILYNMSLFHF